MHALPPPCHPGTDRKPPVPARRSFPQARAAVGESGSPAVPASSPPCLLQLLSGLTRPSSNHRCYSGPAGGHHVSRRIGRQRSKFLGLSYERGGLIVPIDSL